MFELVEIDVNLFKSHIVGVAVVENPTFEHSDYDDAEVTQKKYEGKYIVVARRIEYGREFLLFRYEGEPKLDMLNELHQEYVEKEEKERKVEEMEEKKREELEKKWGDPAKVVEAIMKALPGWADGAVVVSRRVCGVDCDTYYYVYPVKRSNRGVYYSPEWRALEVGVPDRFLENFADTVVLRDGKTAKVKQERSGSSKYVVLKLGGEDETAVT